MEGADVQPLTIWDFFFYGLALALAWRLFRWWMDRGPAKEVKRVSMSALEQYKDKYYTVEEVKKHNSMEDCWLIVDDKVYDVTSYVEDHVGGPEAISKRAGLDNTKGFYGIQHPEKVRDMIKEYFIGNLRETAKTK